MNTPNEIEIPTWFLEHVGEFFLVAVRSDGSAYLDGGHSDIEGIVRARKLLNGIFRRSHEDEKYYAIQVVEIPDTDVPVNEEAMNLMGRLVNNEHVELD